MSDERLQQMKSNDEALVMIHEIREKGQNSDFLNALSSQLVDGISLDDEQTKMLHEIWMAVCR